ncbi:MAG: SIR2 family protein [Kiloniellaceae bacterium]
MLFLGAGISMNSENAQGQRPPSWHGFLKAGIQKCGGAQTELKRLLKRGDYLSCCQIIKYKLGHDWVPLLEETFLSPKFIKSEIHEAILNLDSSIVVTPNFDKIYDNYATAETENLLKIKKYYDDDIPRALRGSEKQRLIIKMHGCIDTPDKLIFSREDYADIRSKYANFYRAMDALILTNTFLFIGCGMNDPDLSLLLEQYARSFGAAPPHYLALSEKRSTEYIKMLESNYNLRILPYSSADAHKELLDSIVALNERVEKKREEISQSNLW